MGHYKWIYTDSKNKQCTVESLFEYNGESKTYYVNRNPSMSSPKLGKFINGVFVWSQMMKDYAFKENEKFKNKGLK